VFFQLVGPQKGIWAKNKFSLKRTNAISKVFSRKIIKTMIYNYEFEKMQTEDGKSCISLKHT
jgi:hypothetical protein